MSQHRSAVARTLESHGLDVTEGRRNGMMTMTCTGFDHLDTSDLDAVAQAGHERPISWWLIDAASGREVICGARYTVAATRGWLRELTGR